VDIFELRTVDLETKVALNFPSYSVWWRECWEGSWYVGRRHAVLVAC